ncbi:MAG: nucleotidyl transferase AbiEii/AbiGii toxin family protein [Ignavibacteriaceae bacterium]|jgi:predicted nucleotidyltransferase component of viral defense system|nr:nucleotidyl transferase AbiEii/AbiGii toxin family protein [Ignavibacteriaceae bacterium]
MSIFHKEILTKNQLKFLPLIRKFKRSFFLVGGTAIALYLGHRRSIDFDLFTKSKLKRKVLEDRIRNSGFKIKTVYQSPSEWTFFIDKVKITFFEFKYPVQPENNFDNIIRIPSLIELAAMKAFALGERAKWKDYVDLYYILQNNIPLKKIAAKAEQIFGGGFNEKLLREQLTYFEDINYEEEVEFLVSEPSKDAIKKYLTKTALQ